MMNSWEQGVPVHVADVCEDMTLPVALCVIAKAGYGQDVKWKDEAPAPAGHEFTFKHALLTVSDKIHLPLLLPSWAWGLRESWRHVKKANDELRLYIQEMVAERRQLKDMASRSLAEEKHDIFNQIIQAHDDNDTLSEDELIGNAFVFLIAGHETTAHSLVEIRSAQPKDREFTYDDMPKIPYALAVLYETLRLYPMAPVIPKYAPDGASLITGGSVPHSPKTVNVPESARVSILAKGLHYNPQYWDDPFDFYPDRFMDSSWNRDAFIPFSVGPRACIGRR
ncbi:cytochrome P450 family protein [Ceratobasidium sp. AG-Ba]|nr:cytochrome P450 family protein [Ceratobasidium sp. AG-Ba]